MSARPPSSLGSLDVRLAIAGLLRALLSTVALTLAYLLAPFDGVSGAGAVVIVVVSLAAFSALLAWYARSIVRATHPLLRGVEALGVLVPFLLLIFAAVYASLATSDSNAFSEDVSKLDGLYFTITVFSTVGFGDITARSPTARAVVSIQMIANLIVLGAGLRVIVGAIRTGRERSGRGPFGGVASPGF